MRNVALTLLFLGLLVAACDQIDPISSDSTLQEPTIDDLVLSKKGTSKPIDFQAMLLAVNRDLEANGSNIRAEAIEFLTIGVGRPDNRILQLPFRWVPNDPRRLADGDNLTYIFDTSGGNSASGVTSSESEAAADAAFETWNTRAALSGLDVVKRPDPGTDITIFDAFFCEGTFGNPFAADMVSAGFFPAECFGTFTLAFSVTFIFVDGDGIPTDINNDGYIDAALNEVYFNNAWGNPTLPEDDVRRNFPWGINVELPGIDVQSVSLHEYGHSLDTGHFGPPPDAVMNPVFAGPRQEPFATDDAAMTSLWRSWPSR